MTGRLRAICVLRLAVGLALTLSFSVAPSFGTIHYTISLEHPEAHLFHVTMEVPDVQGQVDLQMAAWDALYQIRDFSSHVRQVEARIGGQTATIEKLDKLTWRVHGSGTVQVAYDTFWDEPGPFSSQLNAEHAFINPAMVLLYTVGRTEEKTTLSFPTPPDGWRVASSLSFGSSQESANGGTLVAEVPTFNTLADSPIEISKFEEFTLPDLKPTVRVAVHGDNYKRKDVEAALRKLCAYELKMMEGAPYDGYTFIFHIGKAAQGAGGGMEHANSTAINVPSAEYLPNVSAHEFFHLWNVKRIRPASLEPIDRTREMYTRSLWFAEGVTNTYASYALVRTGVWSKQEFLQDLSAQISELEMRPADKWQSAEESSLDAWLEKYPLYNQPRSSISYYTKGQVLGVLLDVLIRDRTDNQRSLDDVLRSMNADFAKEGKFYRDSQDVEAEAEKVAGGSFADFFQKYVSAATPVPYGEMLAKAGLEVQEREIVRPVLGFLLQRDSGGPWTVAAVEPDGPAAKARLLVGDVVVKWNGGEPPRYAQRWLGQQKPGDVLHLRVKREEKELSLDVTLGEAREKFYQVTEMANANARAKRLREGLLKGTTDPVTAGKN